MSLPPPPGPTPPPAPPPIPKPIEPAWPTFPGGASFVGTSKRGISVWYDPMLGSQGLMNAQALLADADRVAALNDSIFGLSTDTPVNVVVLALGGATDGTGGADHLACDFVDGGNIEVCASFGAPERVSSLFEAELSECAMGGNLCGLSTGEALSRWCAMVTANNALFDFETGSLWDKAGRPDYVSRIDPTDQDGFSTGCGMVFISWLLQKYTLVAIAQVMVSLGNNGTLADLYASLSGKPASQAFHTFSTVLPPRIIDDDPFGSLAAAIATA